jgi:hypothetical protein
MESSTSASRVVVAGPGSMWVTSVRIAVLVEYPLEILLLMLLLLLLLLLLIASN